MKLQFKYQEQFATVEADTYDACAEEAASVLSVPTDQRGSSEFVFVGDAE